MSGVQTPSEPSRAVISVALPPADPAAVRVQLRLTLTQPDVDMVALRETAAADVARALAVGGDSVRAVDSFGRGQYIVLELQYAPTQAGRAGSAATADILAQQLRLLAQRPQGTMLGEGEVSRLIDSDGVTRLDPAGTRTEEIQVSGVARSAAGRLPRAGNGDMMELAGYIVGGVGALGFAAFCIYPFLRHRQLQLHARMSSKYDRIAIDTPG
jgi:hypothetical protein